MNNSPQNIINKQIDIIIGKLNDRNQDPDSTNMTQKKKFDPSSTITIPCYGTTLEKIKRLLKTYKISTTFNIDSKLNKMIKLGEA